jgi:deoxyribodipyrimidine photo-lyase
MWFRRDLRLADQPALAAAAAASADRVVGLFVLDPVLVRSSGAPRLAYLVDSLAALDASIGERLVVRIGDPVDVVAATAAEVGASTVFVSRDHGPYGRRRDTEVAARLRAGGCRLRGVGSPYAVEPGTVTKADGSPYAVFTPFSRSWRAAGWSRPLDEPDRIEWVTVAGDGLPVRPDPGCTLPPAGEEAAHERWDTFLADGRDDLDDAESSLDAYDDRRDRPGVDGTSRLSPALKWGAIHPRQLLADLDDERDGHRAFAGELAWRDFYADVLFHRPETAWQNLNPTMDAIRLDTGPEARARFDVWCAGRTGFPIVDAGMRQLLATGWMHNRVRMIVASFLVKDLHLPWQWGARHFLRHLVDGDLASNNHGWQWSAGTGTDAAPYFRVFNPTAQQERYDPDGTYVRRWIPELGTDAYPAPMVDHASERAEALARYRAVSGASARRR